ncbi:ribonuclease H-like domain-containing protein [Tanacetum coccineum]
MKKNEKRELLKNKITILEGDISASRRSFDFNIHKEANADVVKEMESSGSTRSRAFDVAFDRAYKEESDRIHNLVLKKQLAKVEFFILSEKPLDDDVKKGWTNEMLEFYEASQAENIQDRNGYRKRIKVNGTMEDEVGQDLSVHVSFMTQNEAMLGDFNAILSADDYSKGIANIYEGLREFRSCIELLDMEDLVMNGCFFTWVHKKKDPDSGILNKLDRVMSNNGFLELFESCYTNFLPYVTFDHCPTLMVISDVAVKRKRSLCS